MDAALMDNSLLTTLLEALPIGVVVSDRSGARVISNKLAKEYLGNAMAGDTTTGGPQYGFYRPDGTPFPMAEFPLQRALESGRASESVEILIREPGGVMCGAVERFVRCSAVPIRGNENQIVHVVMALQDITEEQRLWQTGLRLLGETREEERRLHDHDLLNRLERDLTAQLEVRHVLDGTLVAVQELFPDTRASLWLWDEEHPEWLVCQACSEAQNGTVSLTKRIRPEKGFWHDVACAGQSVIVEGDDAQILSLDALGGFSNIPAHSILASPLWYRDRITGVLVAASACENSFDAYSCSLLETLALGAAVAIENAWLHDEAQRSAAAAERARLARELHDSISQALFSASVIAETLPRLWDRDPSQAKSGLVQLQHLTRGALAEMRSLLLELRPATLQETSLDELLKQLVEATSARSHIETSLKLESVSRLPPNVHVALYRIAQESLNNVVKHARAAHVVVTLQDVNGGVELCISDDGRGFNLDSVLPSQTGLEIMKERARAAGMNMRVSSQVERGTDVIVVWSGSATGEE